MSRPISFALVGCGNIGRRHVAVLDSLEDAVLMDLCDADIAKAQKEAELYGYGKVYTDYSEMVANTQAEVVSVCTPHALHKSMSIEAMEAGKHVMVEKPMALTVADGQAMIDAAKANGVKLWVMKQNRFNVPIRLTRQLLDEGWLGKVYMVQCNVWWNRHAGYYADSDWRGDISTEGGALFTQVSHFLDLLIWWFGEVNNANALIDTKLHSIEVEDCGTAQLEFAGGVMGSLSWTTCVYNKNYEGSITIIGEKGTIKIGGRYLNKIEYWDVQSQPTPDPEQFVDQPNMYGKYQGTSSNHDKVFREIIKMQQGTASEVVEGPEGLLSIDAIEKIYQAAR